ncbi:LuxR C-terminal-related transcriptional regulator [Agarilytica rhodophyticola]|uniref:LuxR C-terminal-related transcriptional regulator n=1 Tax=Agarilytica rhodophyticola TaxID=1737490 RepID=UPI000B3410F3|nr:LuxR C-terminal-related transcriptional regulator [Agarilytica rhodophyticola]
MRHNIVKGQADSLLDKLKVSTSIGAEVKSHFSYDSSDSFSFMEEVTRANSLDTVDKAIATIAYQHGFHYYSMFTAMTSLNNNLHLHSIAQGNLDYMMHYRAKGYFSCDPMIRLARCNTIPFVWNAHSYRDKLESDLSINERGVVNDSLDFGMIQALNIPFHSPTKSNGLLRFIRMYGEPMNNKEIYNFTSEVTLLCSMIFEKNCRLLMPAMEANSQFAIVLTPREIEVLQWIACGKNPSYIGDKLGISENTVLTHLKNIRKKLNVRNITHAVAKALALKIISV